MSALVLPSPSAIHGSDARTEDPDRYPKDAPELGVFVREVE